MKATRNLGDLFDAPRLGERVALIDCRAGGTPGTYTYAMIGALADACARGLAKRGLKRGSTVAILSSNRAEYLIAYLGIMRAGLVAVPVNFRFPRETIDHILRDASIELAFYDAECRVALPSRLPAVSFDDAGPGGFQA